MPTWREYHNHANILSKQYLYGVHQTKYKITKTIKSLCISGNSILFGSKCGSIPTDFKCMMFPPSMASPTVAGHEGLMMPVVSAETVGTGWYHVISHLVPIGKVSAIITHISGKVGTQKLKPGLLICSGTNIQSEAKSSQARGLYSKLTELE